MIDYSKTVSREELLTITDEKFCFIKNETEKKFKMIKAKLNWNPSYHRDFLYHSVFIPTSFNLAANDIKASKAYSCESELVKTMMRANISCYDSVKLFDLLLDKNINYNTLLIISKGIKISKTIIELNNHLEKLLQTDISKRINVVTDNYLNNNLVCQNSDYLKLLRLIIENFKSQRKIIDYTNNKLDKIHKIMKYYYSIDDIELITARLMQIIVFERELFKSMEKQKVKTR